MSDEIITIEETETRVIPQRGLVPSDVGGMHQMAQIVHASHLAPKSLNSVEKVFVAMTWGLEVGLTPMASLSNIAVINGKPCIYGDAMKALILASGKCADFVEEPMLDKGGDVVGYRCWSKRTNGMEAESVFTLQDAERANLLKKSGPWQEYRSRMLMFRARGFLCRDLYPDVLGGLISAEEARDYPVDVSQRPARAPVQMPQGRKPDAKPTPKNEAPPAPEGLPEEPDWMPKPPPIEEAETPSGLPPIDAGTVERVTTKTGTGARGEWTKYGIKLSSGEWYNTFDHTAGERLTEAEGTGEVFTFSYKKGKYGRELVEILEDDPHA